MPKKYREDTRGLKAKAQKAEAAAQKNAANAQKAKAMLDSDWAVGTNYRASKKAEAEAEKSARKASKLAAKREAEARDEEMLKSMKKKGKAKKAAMAKKGKLSAFERQMMAAAKKKRAEKKAKDAARMQGKAIVVDASKNLVAPAPITVNENRRRGKNGDLLEATNIDDATSILDLASKAAGNDSIDKHPERRMKAAFAAFSERESARLHQENKGLKKTQIDEKVWKLWQKSDENPMRRAGKG